MSSKTLDERIYDLGQKMKAKRHLQRILFGFGLGAAGLILTAVLWIKDDYYTTLLASHPDYHPILPHNLAWSLPYIFVLFTLISLVGLCFLVLASPPPFTGRQYLLIAVGMSVSAIAYQPVNWIYENHSNSPQGPHSDLAGIFLSRSIWLASLAVVFGVCFFVFCYRRLRSQAAAPTPTP
jgi:drug/metabolite transporter (DMT)-like permease